MQYFFVFLSILFSVNLFSFSYPVAEHLTITAKNLSLIGQRTSGQIWPMREKLLCRYRYIFRCQIAKGEENWITENINRIQYFPFRSNTTWKPCAASLNNCILQFTNYLSFNPYTLQTDLCSRGTASYWAVVMVERYINS